MEIVSVESLLGFLLRCLESGELGASDAFRFAPGEVLEASVESNGEKNRPTKLQLTFNCYRSHVAIYLLPLPDLEALQRGRRRLRDLSGVDVGLC